MEIMSATSPLKRRQSGLQQMANIVTSFLIFKKNNAFYFLMQAILIKYHALCVIFENITKFEIVVCKF